MNPTVDPMRIWPDYDDEDADVSDLELGDVCFTIQLDETLSTIASSQSHVDLQASPPPLDSTPLMELCTPPPGATRVFDTDGSLTPLSQVDAYSDIERPSPSPILNRLRRPPKNYNPSGPATSTSAKMDTIITPVKKSLPPAASAPARKSKTVARAKSTTKEVQQAHKAQSEKGTRESTVSGSTAALGTTEPATVVPTHAQASSPVKMRQSRNSGGLGDMDLD
ncbi:hypothetical protein RQP46_009301 [Phenoliferia psychrophenolica]